jgi:integrase core domain protein
MEKGGSFIIKQEKQQEIALMRYATIAPLIAGLDADYPSK